MHNLSKDEADRKGIFRDGKEQKNILWLVCIRKISKTVGGVG